LTTAGPRSSLAYDAHGNTTVLADQVLGYDGADRHTTTRLTEGTTDLSDDTLITYVRDASNRIVSRTVQGPAVEGVTPAAETVRYAFAGSSLHGVLDGAGVLVERTVSLPGGVSVSIPNAPAGGGSGAGAGEGAAQSWSYPNLHGDNILLADQDGTRVGARASFDPFGQPIDPVTGDIGTQAADDAVTDTTPGMPTMRGWVSTRNCMNTRAVWRPFRWGHGSMFPRWAGSSKSTLLRVESAMITTIRRTRSISLI